jgi:rare lipoprotein A
VLALIVLAGCSRHKQAKVAVPPPPSISRPEPQPEVKRTPPRVKPAPEVSDEDADVFSIPPDTKPISTETGVASWYGPPYHNRRGSNGEIYNMHALTAAHRTLPLGSTVRVTNLKTGNSTLVRITDRGPFIEGRILDLSLAAAKKVDVWQAGLAKVRVDVLQTPAPLQTGGRWAVQIGAFDDEQSAGKLADHLSRKYRTAKVLRFASPTGDWWVRIRVKDDDKGRAQEVAQTTVTTRGAVFLVRLD